MAIVKPHGTVIFPFFGKVSHQSCPNSIKVPNLVKLGTTETHHTWKNRKKGRGGRVVVACSPYMAS